MLSLTFTVYDLGNVSLCHLPVSLRNQSIKRQQFFRNFGKNATRCRNHRISTSFILPCSTPDCDTRWISFLGLLIGVNSRSDDACTIQVVAHKTLTMCDNSNIKGFAFIVASSMSDTNRILLKPQ